MLGPYRVTGRIGEGGMGAVYRATDTRLGRNVAIKVLTAVTLSDKERLQRFEQEARATGMLNHPNLLTIYDVGSTEGTPFLVSELLEGETLRDRLDRGAIPPRKAVDIALQVAHGLAAAHEKGFVDRNAQRDSEGRAAGADRAESERPATAGKTRAALSRKRSRSTLPVGARSGIQPRDAFDLLVARNAFGRAEPCGENIIAGGPA